MYRPCKTQSTVVTIGVCVRVCVCVCVCVCQQLQVYTINAKFSGTCTICYLFI